MHAPYCHSKFTTQRTDIMLPGASAGKWEWPSASGARARGPHHAHSSATCFWDALYSVRRTNLVPAACIEIHLSPLQLILENTFSRSGSTVLVLFDHCPS